MMEIIFLSNLVFKRISISIFIVVTLLACLYFSDSFLLEYLPDSNSIDNAVMEIDEQKATLFDTVNRNQEEDYERLFDDSIKKQIDIRISKDDIELMDYNMNEYYSIWGNMNMTQLNSGWNSSTFGNIPDMRDNTYYKADMTYTDDQGSFEVKEIGIRSKGNVWSRSSPVNDDGNYNEIHYMLKFDETFDYSKETKIYSTLNRRKVFDQTQLVLKYNKNEIWKNCWAQSHVQEDFALDLMNEEGILSPNSSLSIINLYVGDELVLSTLYTITEQINEDFIMKHFNENETTIGDAYKNGFPGTLELFDVNDTDWIGVRDWENNYRPPYSKITNKDISNHDLFYNFVYNLNMLNDQELEMYLDEYFNIDEFIKVLALGVLFGNPDDYRGNANNYYIYVKKNGYVTYIPYDYDHVLHVGWDGSPGFSSAFTINSDIYEWGRRNLLDYSNMGLPLVDRVLTIDKYKLRYEELLSQYIDDETVSYDSFADAYYEAKGLYISSYGCFGRESQDEFYVPKKEAVEADLEYYREFWDD